MKILLKPKIFLSVLLLALMTIGCSKPQSQTAGNMASTRGNAQPQASGKRKKVDYNPNTTRKFKPKSKKQMRKEARLAKKPQYNDAMYFGHKKKPKKRPPGKRKMCKECGMVH